VKREGGVNGLFFAVREFLEGWAERGRVEAIVLKTAKNRQPDADIGTGDVC